MALFENQTTTNLQDLLTKLNTFFTTGGGGNPGWNADRFNVGAGEWAISKTSSTEDVEVAFQWDTGSPNALGVYQYRSGSGAGNYIVGSFPYGQIGDSGNGAASTTDATLLTARSVPIGNTPIQYWAFASSTTPHYGYVVVEVSTGTYVSFGFGVLEKENDFTGGEFAFGYRFIGGINNNVAVQTGSTQLLDGLLTGASLELHAATVHVEGQSDTPTGGLWSVSMGAQSGASLGNDRQAAPKARTHYMGGFRAGSHAVMFGQFIGTINMGLIPTYPIVGYHYDRDISTTSATPNALTPLGVMPDIRGAMLTNFQPLDEVDIDGDTWIFFPTRRRYTGVGVLTNTSGYQGILIKKN